MEQLIKVNKKGQFELIIKHNGKKVVKIIPDEKTAYQVLSDLRSLTEVGEQVVDLKYCDNPLMVDTRLDKNTFGACALRWLESPQKIETETIRRYCSLLKKWAIPALSKKLVYEINRSEIKSILMTGLSVIAA